MGGIFREAGYADSTADKPGRIQSAKSWEELMDERLSDDDLSRVHSELLNAHRLDHMVFPLNVTDDEITDLLRSTGCKVRKFMHSETQTHCWFWSPDTMAQRGAVELAYKLKGRLTQKIDLSLRKTGDVLDDLEKETDYGEVGRQAEQQVVEVEPPVQDQGQTGDNSDVQAEHTPTETPQG